MCDTIQALFRMTPFINEISEKTLLIRVLRQKLSQNFRDVCELGFEWKNSSGGGVLYVGIL